MVTEEQKKFIINEQIKGNKAELPKILYKYRPFDQFTYDMLENHYLYFCPAKNLDDPSECTVSFDMQNYIDIQGKQLTALCVSDIVQMIKPYTNQEDFERSKSIIAKLITSDGLLKKDCLPDVALELQQLAPNADIGSLVNWLGNIPEIIDEPDNSAQMEKLFQVVRNAREETGICSLTQLKDDAAMWNDYAGNDRGYCVEFDMSNYQYQQMLFPVVYKDNRQNNIFMTIISDFVGQMTVEVSQEEINADRSSRLRMFLTKDTKWAAQEEWRLIGKAHQKLTAPSIKAIYLGKNASEGDRKQMKTFCQTYKIQLIQR